MMIKSMARKSISFGQLLAYFNGPEKSGQALLHNLETKADDLVAVRGEFNANAHLLPPRKNGNMLYHEILSFGEADGPAMTPQVLEDLIRHYLELRAPYALAYAKPHFDTDCPHVHLLISANNVGSHQRLRLSRQEFRQIQRQLEQYQKERYPFLMNSLAQDRRPRRAVRETRPEQERHRRGDHTQSRKETVRQLVSHELAVAQSGPDCYRRLLSHDLRLYRRGNAIGVEDLKSFHRYRLVTLGLAETFSRSLAAWQRLPEQLRSLRETSSRSRLERRPSLPPEQGR